MRKIYTHETAYMSGDGQTRKQNKAFADASGIEYYIPHFGITYFSPKINQHYTERGMTSGEPPEQPWLDHESRSIMDLVQANQVTLVEGDLGAGKSTAIFGLRSLLRQGGQPYVHLDGGYTRRHQSMAAAVRHATRTGAIAIIESPDHWYTNAQARWKLGIKRTEPIRETMLQAIYEHVASGGKIVLTSHTAQWFEHNSTPEMQASFQNFLGDIGAVRHRVYGIAPDSQSLTYVCQKVRPDGDGANYASHYLRLAERSEVPSANTFRVAKLLSSVAINELAGIDQLSFDEMVRSADQSTRDKMGAADNYSFIPHDTPVLVR